MNGEFARRYDTYAGYHTLGPIKHEVFPHLPMEIPHPRHGVGPKKPPWVEEGCGNYLRQLAHGDPSAGIKRNHLFEGVLLATRFSDALDISSTDQLDFMAQPVQRR